MRNAPPGQMCASKPDKRTQTLVITKFSRIAPGRSGHGAPSGPEKTLADTEWSRRGRRPPTRGHTVAKTLLNS